MTRLTGLAHEALEDAYEDFNQIPPRQRAVLLKALVVHAHDGPTPTISSSKYSDRQIAGSTSAKKTMCADILATGLSSLK